MKLLKLGSTLMGAFGPQKRQKGPPWHESGGNLINLIAGNKYLKGPMFANFFKPGKEAWLTKL